MVLPVKLFSISRMDRLPNEILEQILSHVPVEELLQSHCLVSRKWYHIISRKKFIQWKKLYGAYSSRRHEQSKITVETLCQENNITSAGNCLQGLLRCLVSLCEPQSVSRKVTELMESHPLYSLAEKLVLEHIMVAFKPSSQTVWLITTMICIISSEMWEIYRLICILSHYQSDFTMTEVNEKFYMLATLFLAFTRNFHFGQRVHYNLHYAIKLFENSWGLSLEVTPPTLKYTTHSQLTPTKSTCSNKQALTYEQYRIVNHRIEGNHLVKIVAFAGTGKTTTLLRFAEKNRNLKILLIVYNRSVADEAGRKFPPNVLCKTVHTLANARMVKNGPFKEKVIGNIFPSNLVEEKILRDRKGMKRYFREQLVLDTINRFLASADKSITIKHTPEKITKSSENGEPTVEKLLSHDDRLALVQDARIIWSIMKNPKDRRLNLPHDGYLKLWQLTKPNLFKSENVDCVMVDEGQDMNGAMLDIFLSYPGARIIVGDPHQQIYRWRYAINALDKVPSTHTFYLTQSFRFGPEIGFMANACLRVLNRVHDKFIVGAKIHDALIGRDPLRKNIQSGKQICFLARTNLTLLKKAVQVLGCDSPNASQSPSRLPTISFAGGLEGMNFYILIDILNMRRGAFEKIHHPFLRNRKLFPNYTTFAKYVEAVMDKEWSSRIAQVNWAGDRIEYYIEVITKCHVNMNVADVVFSTAHRAKGLEWDTVALLDDFTPSLSFAEECSEEMQEERNLLYVAVTRAQRQLVINPACYYTLLEFGERFERVVDTFSYIEKHGSAVNCRHCREVLPGTCGSKNASLATLPLQLMTVRLEMPVAEEEGILCSMCAALPFYTYPVFECYRNELPPVRIRDDVNHIAYRFLMGPTQEESEVAEAFYAQQRLLMLDGFVRARHLAAPRAPIVVNVPEPLFLFAEDIIHEADVNQPGPIFPDDDDIFLEVPEIHPEHVAVQPGQAAPEQPDQNQPVFPDDDHLFFFDI